MNLFVMLGYIVAVNWFCLTVVWLLSLKIKDASIIDIYWGIGFIVMAWACLLINLMHNPTSVSFSQWLINFMVTIWGFRLSLHLAVRNLGKDEDYRYVAMRINLHLILGFLAISEFLCSRVCCKLLS